MEQNLPKILVLEDDPENQMYIYFLLHKKYFPVICASHDEALKAMHDYQYRAMIIDIGLRGEKDGLDFIRIIKTDPVLRDVPVICYTAFTYGEDRENALNAGANAFLSKPVPNQLMLDTLESFVYSHA